MGQILPKGWIISLLRHTAERMFLSAVVLLPNSILFPHALNAIATGDVFAALIQVIYTASIGMLYGAIYLRSRNLWGVILMHTLTDIFAFLAVFESNATGMDIIFCVFGSLLFIALAFYLIRPAKRAEIDVL